METNKYTLLSMLKMPTLEQFIVPEIQRDYIWQISDVIDLMESLKDGFTKAEDTPYLGFIYAYRDKDYPYKYMLIDGQQRITTIFLFLLSCYHKLGKKLPSYIIKNDKPKLDYKVREATHDFLTDFINFLQENQGLENLNIVDQIWYHKGYENDSTIKNMVINFLAIRNWIKEFDEENLSKFLKYVEENVELSYFNIENGRDGEDLYIYMNSRGRQLEANETLKAKFLSKENSQNKKYEWGAKWEIWQDFFWKHRDKDEKTEDADPGFNEFLKIIQLITMCKSGKTSSEVVSFANGKSNQKIELHLLPPSLDELEVYFKAFRWLVESEKIQNFFLKYEEENYLTTVSDRSLIDYFRIIPIITLLANTSLRDENQVLRFTRFFYNVSRKSNVSKDISNQLPAAINLILEYSIKKDSDFDVYDLLEFKIKRSTLIDKEEAHKLAIYKTNESLRKDLELAFWEAEDHPIFNGEIDFLLSSYWINESQELDFKTYHKTWSAFKTIFPGKGNANNSQIIRALLFYGYTWAQDSPYYYNNFDCKDWYWLVRQDKHRVHLLSLLEDMHEKPISHLDTIIKQKIKSYFIKNEIISLEVIKAASSLRSQVKVLTAIDYFSEKKIWKDYGYLAEDNRFSSKTYGDKPFFNEDRLIYNVFRYVDQGWNGRVLDMIKDTLKNTDELNRILAEILIVNDNQKLTSSVSEELITD
jgi:hypothetical protein